MFSRLNLKFLSGREIALLLSVSLVVNSVIISLQPVPGYMDAAYYFTTGVQMAEGNGFSEPFIWNYLDNPQTIPHPSHSYWYPLASLVSALGMGLTGKMDFLSARIGFFLIALFIPIAVARLAWIISGKKSIALVSGFLAIFCGYYLPFIVTTDNYAIYLLLGAIYFQLLEKMSISRAYILGLLAGLINLARADGLLWLPLTFIVVTYLSYQQMAGTEKARPFPWRENLGVIIGYLSGFGFWLGRSLIVYGSLLPPGSSHAIWMTEYNQLFTLTPEIYTFHSWLAQGWKEILLDRLNALWMNLGTGILGQGMVFLFPLILIGVWSKRSLFPVRFAFFGWVLLLLVESILFPFSSVQGGFFHAGTVFQPVWFILAPVGLERVMDFLLKGRFNRLKKSFFQIILVFGTIGLSILLVKIRVVDSGWNEGEYRYIQAEEILLSDGAKDEDIVLVVNPPAYNAMTGRRAIVIPHGQVTELLTAADRYNTEYVIIEKDRSPSLYQLLTENLIQYSEFNDIGGFDDVRIYAIDHSK